MNKKLIHYLQYIGLIVAADLNAIREDKNELIDVPLLFDDDGEPESGFKVLCADSDEYQAVDRQYRVAGIKKSARRGRGIDAKTDTGAAELVGVLDSREDAILAACIKQIYGFTDGQKKGEDGQPLFQDAVDKDDKPIKVPVMIPAELNAGTLKRIWKEKPTWRNKVLAAIETDQVFIKASSGAGVP